MFIDLETYNPVHDVRNVGAHKYAQNAEILILCYAIDDEPVRRIDWTVPVGTSDVMPLFMEQWSIHRKAAHHAAFERRVLDQQGFPSSPEDWDDTAVLTLTCGLPAKMATAGTVLGLADGEGKSKRGQQLINRFCKPAPSNHKAERYTRETHPEEWAEFIEYCAQDVEVCRLFWRDLPHWVYDMERANWLLDQKINDRGLPIDTAFADRAINSVNGELYRLNRELETVTGGAVPDAYQILSLRNWVNARGVAADSLAVEALEDLLGRVDLPNDVRRALEIRQLAGRASVAKYVSALYNSTKGRLYDSIQFYGANRTGRTAGRQLQPQNMFRPKIFGRELAQARQSLRNDTAHILFANPIEVAASCVRTVIAAPAGRKLVASDLANIEGRMLAWIAGEQWKLDAFAAFDAGNGPDLYKLAYARAFDLPVERVTKDERQVGKVMELALGYQGGIGAFVEMAKTHDVDLPETTILDLVAGWRGAHPATRQLWNEVQSAAIAAVVTPGLIFKVRMLRFQCVEHNRWRWLLIKIPNGRLLCYFDPRVEEFEHPKWGVQHKLSYTGQIIGGTWGRVPTYGGKLVENITQAASRDVLYGGMHHAEDAGYPIVLTVYDEIVAETPDTEEFNPEALSELMTRVPTWCEGLPLAADGYQDKFYRKD